MKHRVLLCLSVVEVVIIVMLMRAETPINRPKPKKLTHVIISENSSKIALQAWRFHLTMVQSSLQRMGYSVDNLPPWSALWTDKIHLCVMFNLRGNKPKKDVTDILISYYYPFFENITLIFDGAYWKRPDYVPELVDVIGCESDRGRFKHKCIQSCMKQGTEETKGYLYISDDMFINLTKMADLPTTKVWFSKMITRKYSWILDPGPGGWDWVWWAPPAHNSKKLEYLINIMPSEWKEQLKKTAGFPDLFKAMATTDIIYIPRAFKSNLNTVLNFIVNNMEDLFDEIATCLALNIAVPNEIVSLTSGYLWRSQRNVAEMERTAKIAYFVHPVKLGVEEHRKLWIQYMEKQLYSILQSSSVMFKHTA